jgi:hypothetical protein
MSINGLNADKASAASEVRLCPGTGHDETRPSEVMEYALPNQHGASLSIRHERISRGHRFYKLKVGEFRRLRKMSHGSDLQGHHKPEPPTARPSGDRKASPCAKPTFQVDCCSMRSLTT